MSKKHVGEAKVTAECKREIEKKIAEIVRLTKLNRELSAKLKATIKRCDCRK